MCAQLLQRFNMAYCCQWWQDFNWEHALMFPTASVSQPPEMLKPCRCFELLQNASNVTSHATFQVATISSASRRRGGSDSTRDFTISLRKTPRKSFVFFGDKTKHLTSSCHIVRQRNYTLPRRMPTQNKAIVSFASCHIYVRAWRHVPHDLYERTNVKCINKTCN